MAKKATGRPSAFTKGIADTICKKLAEGMSLREICRDEAMPAQSMVYRWLEQSEEFREQYARAREAQADTIADEILEIADDGTNDWVTRQNSDGSTDDAVDHEHISRSKLRVDARKWLLAKMAPKKYGDKVVQEHQGPNGGDIPLGISVSFVTPNAV